MRRRLPWLLAASVLLAACQVQVTPPAKRAGSDTAVAARPDETPSAGAATAKPAAPADKPANLLVPTEGGATLTGRVQVDPGYALKHAAGKLIAPDGGTLLAAGSAIISQDGGGLISQDGGGLVAQGGGNVVAPANLISQDGGGLISQDGGGLISQDGGGIISNDGGSYALLAADEPATAGELVPAAGMVVGVRSLDTGKLLQLGADAQGQPVYAVYTNLKGEYKVGVPEADKNVEIVALVPGVHDARLRFGSIAAAAGTADVTDDTTTVARYLFSATATFADRLGKCKDEKEMAEVLHLSERPDTANYLSGVRKLLDLYNAVGYRCLPREKQLAIAYLLADRLLSQIPTKDIPPHTLLVPTNSPTKRTETDAFVMLVNLFRERRVAVTPLFEKPDAGAAILAFPAVQSVLKEGRRVGMLGAGDGYTFQRPADYGDFIARAIMGREFSDPTTVIKEVDGLDADLAKHFGASVEIARDADWFGAAYAGIGNFMLIGFTAFGDNKEISDEVAQEARGVVERAASCP